MTFDNTMTSVCKCNVYCVHVLCICVLKANGDWVKQCSSLD